MSHVHFKFQAWLRALVPIIVVVALATPSCEAHAASLASTVPVSPETQLELKLAAAEALRVSADFAFAQMDEARLRDVVTAEDAAQTLLDQMILERISAYVTDTYRRVREQASLGDCAELTRAKNEYEAAVKNFGGPKDFLRFNALRRYQERLAAMTEHAPSLREKFTWSSVHQALDLLGPFAKLTFRTLVPEMDDDHGTPLAKAADGYFARLRELKKTSVRIEGSALLKKPAGPREINLIISNHVSAERDAMVLSALNLESYVTFGALNLEGEGLFSIAMHPLMKPVMKKIDAQRDVILLGRHSDPIARLVEVLKSGRTQNLFLFPQGMISLGFDEVNPLKPAFSEKIIQRLQAEGLTVNLQVMTMPDNSIESAARVTPLKEPSSLNLRAYLEAPMSDTALRKTLSVIGPDGMDTLIRAQWIHRLRTYDPNYLGLIREGALQKRIQRIACRRVLATQ